MRVDHLFASTVLLALCCAACDRGDSARTEDETAPSAAKSAAPTAATASASAAAAGKCEPLGCKGEGTFFKKCDCKGKDVKSPFAIKVSGGYSDFFKQPEFEVTNTTDKPIHWGSAAVYYYDKAGEQLETQIRDKTYKVSRVNGSNFTLKPKETKTITLGFKKESEPKGIDTMQVVIDGWCFGTHKDKSSHLCIKIDRAPDERPKAE